MDPQQERLTDPNEDQKAALDAVLTQRLHVSKEKVFRRADKWRGHSSGKKRAPFPGLHHTKKGDDLFIPLIHLSENICAFTVA